MSRYEARSGNDVEVRYGDTSELASTILEEGDNSPADLFFSQDAGALGALEKEELRHASCPQTCSTTSIRATGLARATGSPPRRGRAWSPTTATA